MTDTRVDHNGAETGPRSGRRGNFLRSWLLSGLNENASSSGRLALAS